MAARSPYDRPHGRRPCPLALAQPLLAAVADLALARSGEPRTLQQALAAASAAVALGAFEGAVVGFAQRLVLRTRVPALRGWVRSTVAGAMAAWTLGIPIVFLGAQVHEWTSDPTLIVATAALALLAAGAVVGAVHGCVLGRLLAG